MAACFARSRLLPGLAPASTAKHPRRLDAGPRLILSEGDRAIRRRPLWISAIPSSPKISASPPRPSVSSVAERPASERRRGSQKSDRSRRPLMLGTRTALPPAGAMLLHPSGAAGVVQNRTGRGAAGTSPRDAKPQSRLRNHRDARCAIALGRPEQARLLRPCRTGEIDDTTRRAGHGLGAATRSRSSCGKAPEAAPSSPPAQ
jgi:hypothetical protein